MKSKIIVICGSIKKASEEMEELEKKLLKKGYKVIRPIITKPEKNGIFNHFQAIKTADEIYFVNPKDYMGINTTLELGYAIGLKKKCIMLFPETKEICRKILLDLSTP